MTTTTEKKSTLTLDNKKAVAIDAAAPSVDSAQSSTATQPEKSASDNLREAIKALDAERTELVVR